MCLVYKVLVGKGVGKKELEWKAGGDGVGKIR
jgi:hypothetical protein